MKKLSVLAMVILLISIACSSLAATPDELQGYNTKKRTWQYVEFGSYPTEADGTLRPIQWRVLSVKDQQATLLSQYILFAHRVDPNCYPINKNSEPYAGWETSELFQYLNQEFLGAAFTPGEQSVLVANADGGLVSLPASNDLKNEKLGFGSQKLRQAQSTEYAKANGLYVYQGAKKYSPYWLSTRSESKKYAQRKVQDNGAIGYICVEVADVGVRPLITLDLGKILSLDGAGTLEDPYKAILPEALEEQTVTEETEAPVVEEAAPAAEPEPEAEEVQPEEPAESSAEEAAETEPVSSAYAEFFPALTAEGFLPAGEPKFVLEDEEKGLWLYASQDLRVEIVRKESLPKKNRPWRWYEADIFVRKQSGESMKVYYAGGQPGTKEQVEIRKIAQENKLVFSMNSDWYYYRVKRNAKKKVMPVGIIIREGEVLYDDPAKKLWTSIPNRDILALYEDGNMEVYDYNAITTEELVAKGARDVLSFGPVLLSNGEITAQTLDISSRQNDNPRSGIGMVAPGHYVSIVMEGRRKGISVGCSVKEFAELFQLKGCTVAYNLDGGGTASMMFMGKYVNQMGNFTADARKQTEVLGVGVSDQVE